MDVALAVNRRPGRLWAFLQFPLTRIVIAVTEAVRHRSPRSMSTLGPRAPVA